MADRRGYTYTVEPVDEQEVLKAIRHAKLSADFVIATIHAYDPGNWSEEPADFLPVLAKKAIEAGADLRAANRGVPRLARPDVARTILERLQRLSQPFGTHIAIEQNVGVIRLAEGSTSRAR